MLFPANIYIEIMKTRDLTSSVFSVTVLSGITGVIIIVPGQRKRVFRIRISKDFQARFSQRKRAFVF